MLKFLGLNQPEQHLAAITHRYLWTAGVIAALATVAGLLEGVGITLLVPLLSILSGESGKAQNEAVLGYLRGFAQNQPPHARLFIVTAGLLTCMLLKLALQAVENVFAGWVDGRIGHEIRCALAARLNALPYKFFLVESPERMLNVLSSDSWQTSDAIRIWLNRIAACATALVFGLMLMIVSWKLSLCVLFGGLISRWVQKRAESRLRALSTQMISTNGKLAQRMLFAIFGARIIRIFHTQEHEDLIFAETSDELRRANLHLERLSGSLAPLLEGMQGVLLVFVLVIAVLTGVGLPILASFLILMNRLQPHLRIVEQSGAAFASASGHFKEVGWMLACEASPGLAVGSLPFSMLTHGIEFDNVTFHYGERSQPALACASFTLYAGRSTAILGGSGAGKSTTVNLLCRLLEPVSGLIRVDGRPLSEISMKHWLGALAIAGQDLELMDGTIAENIAYGLPHADRAKIAGAALAAHADFIDDLPHGFDTLVGPRGLALSGGQRQRISIARAIAREPKILILDEATNAVDPETESGILEMLHQLPNSLTTIVISHRPTTLARCQDAILLDGGRVKSFGPIGSILDGVDIRSRAQSISPDPLVQS